MDSVRNKVRTTHRDMVMNVFGILVTDAIVRTYAKFAMKDVITRMDRAKVAIWKKNANDREANALKYVEALGTTYGDGVSMLCMVYNATGETLSHVTDNDWSGEIVTSPYPQKIANSQWAAFLHVHTRREAVGAEYGVVVCRGKNDAGKSMDWVLSWSVPWGPWDLNKVYTMAYESSYFDSEAEWKILYNQLLHSSKKHSSHHNGCVSDVAIGGGTSPQFYGLITLTGVSE